MVRDDAHLLMSLRPRCGTVAGVAAFLIVHVVRGDGEAGDEALV